MPKPPRLLARFISADISPWKVKPHEHPQLVESTNGHSPGIWGNNRCSTHLIITVSRTTLVVAKHRALTNCRRVHHNRDLGAEPPNHKHRDVQVELERCTFQYEPDNKERSGRIARPARSVQFAGKRSTTGELAMIYGGRDLTRADTQPRTRHDSAEPSLRAASRSGSAPRPPLPAPQPRGQFPVRTHRNDLNHTMARRTRELAYVAAI